MNKSHLLADSLDLVEHLMTMEERYGIEVTEEDCEHWQRTGDWPWRDDPSGSPVPWPRPFPTLSGGAAVALPDSELPDAPNEPG